MGASLWPVSPQLYFKTPEHMYQSEQKTRTDACLFKKYLISTDLSELF